MNYVFFGTPEFAAIILEGLIRADMAPVALVCNPDRPIGRRKTMTAPAAKQLLTSFVPASHRAAGQARAGILVLQPEKLDEKFIGSVKSIKPDFAIVAAYAKIIPKEIIELFPRGLLGVHPSLLPKYRGSSPIQSAILNGEKESGITLYILDEKVDHGPIIAQKRSMIDGSWTYLELQKRLAELGGELLVETMPKFMGGKASPQTQKEAEATLTRKFTSDDGFVSESDLNAARGGSRETAIAIDRKIRALNPEPGVWTISQSMVHGSWSTDAKRIKLLEAKIENGRLVLKKVQEEGGKPRIVKG